MGGRHDQVVVEGAGQRFEWIDGWAQLDAPHAWPHSAVVVTAAGEIVTCDPNGGSLVFLDPSGRPLRSVPIDLGEAHGITLVMEDGAERLWLADAAARRDPAAAYSSEKMVPAVVKVDLSGSILAALERPSHPLYEEGRYKPTWVAVDEVRFGGDGTIWVADGYGQSLVHRYGSDGDYLVTLTGDQGAGRFDCPHTLFIDRRHSEPELYVADRGNRRIQVFDLDGRFKRSVGDGELSGPTAFAAAGDLLLVVENWPPRITVLDESDRVVGRLCEDPRDYKREGWPNEIDESGHPRRYTGLEPGWLNSPHGIAIGHDGALYLTEFVIGTRMTRLRPVTQVASKEVQ